jgi:hypothetical protein
VRIKKVAVYSNLFFPDYVGGGERLAEMTAEGFVEAGLEPTVFTTQLGSGLARRRWRGLDVCDVPVEPNGEHWRRRVSAAHLTTALRESGAELLHVVGVAGASTAVAVGRSLGLPVGVATTDYSLICDTATLIRRDGRGCDANVSPSDCFRCRLEDSRGRDRLLAIAGRLAPKIGREALKASLSFAAGEARGRQVEWWQDILTAQESRAGIWQSVEAVVHGTRYAADAHSRAAPAYRQKSVVCHHPIRLRQHDKRPRPSTDPINIGFIGRAIPIKGLDWLLDAMKQDDRAKTLNLFIYAPANDDWREYQDELHRRADAMADRVAWRSSGALDDDDLDEIHREIDVLVVPSRWPEYVGLVTLEALARGTPVVLSDFAPQRELFGHLPQARFVDPQDSRALTAAIAELAHAFPSGAPAYQDAPTPAEYAKLLLNAYRQ